jgi:hypothetical protein
MGTFAHGPLVAQTGSPRRRSSPGAGHAPSPDRGRSPPPQRFPLSTQRP